MCMYMNVCMYVYIYIPILKVDLKIPQTGPIEHQLLIEGRKYTIFLHQALLSYKYEHTYEYLHVHIYIILVNIHKYIYIYIYIYICIYANVGI
jgi:hypothetical protein